jgi:hypothetical protein
LLPNRWVTARRSPYERYRNTPTGVSPMSVPGTKNGVVTAGELVAVDRQTQAIGVLRREHCQLPERREVSQ